MCSSDLPYGGHIKSFAVSGTNIFAGTVGGGVFLSTDNGTSWTQVNNGLTNTDMSSLAVAEQIFLLELIIMVCFYPRITENHGKR